MSQSYQVRDEQGRARFTGMVSHMPLGAGIEFSWRAVSEKRRDVQNRLMWSWNNEIQVHMRETHGITASADDWHDILCRKLMPVDAVPLQLPDGTTYEAGRWRSSKASVREMSEYLGLLDAYCAESLGLLLPHPDDLYNEAMARRAG